MTQCNIDSQTILEAIETIEVLRWKNKTDEPENPKIAAVLRTLRDSLNQITEPVEHE